MRGWIVTCQTIASMKNLHNLSIVIYQSSFEEYFKAHSQEENESIVRELLNPLCKIEMGAGGKDHGGYFDVISLGWKIPYSLHRDFPFRVIQDMTSPLGVLLGDKHDVKVSRSRQMCKYKAYHSILQRGPL